MTIPSGPNNLANQGQSDQTNNQNILADYQQWWEDEQQVQSDEDALKEALANLENVSKGGNYNSEFEAMMLFFTQVFPDVLNIQQDNLNALSDSQNISSDLRSFVSSIENDSNNLSTNQLFTNSNPSGTPSWSNPNFTAAAQAESVDLYGNTCDLYAWSKFLGSSDSAAGLTTGSQSALDPTNAQQLSGYALSIARTFDGNVEEEYNGSTQDSGQMNIRYDSYAPVGGVRPQWDAVKPVDPVPGTPTNNETFGDGNDGFNIAYVLWYSNQSIVVPNTTPGIGNTVWTDNTPLKEIQQDLQSANSGTSSLSTTTQTTEQFYTNQYNQLTGIDNSMQQNYVGQISAIIQNQSPNG